MSVFSHTAFPPISMMWLCARSKATWHALGTASIHAGTRITKCFLFLRMCVSTPLRQKKTPEIKRSCLQTRRHHGIRYKKLRCTLHWIVTPRSPNINVASEFGRRVRVEAGVFSWRVIGPMGASIFPMLKLGERGAHALGYLVDSPGSCHRLKCIPTTIDGRAIFSGTVDSQGDQQLEIQPCPSTLKLGAWGPTAIKKNRHYF